MSKTGTHGGRRPNAGRPNLSGQTNHMSRPRIGVRDTVHVWLKFHRQLPDLRTKKKLSSLYRAIFKSHKFQWQVLDHAFTRSEIHLLVRASDNRQLSRSIQSLSISLAKSLNTLLNRHGSVFDGRYRMELANLPSLARRLRQKFKSLREAAKSLPRTVRLSSMIQLLISQVVKENQNIAIQIKAFAVF